MCSQRQLKRLSNDRPRHWRPWEHENGSNSSHVTPKLPLLNFIPHKCVYCDATFRRESELKRHKSSVHLRRYECCHKCGKVFTRKDNLTRHVKLAHFNENKPSCSFCSKSLSRKDAVQRHEVTCSKNPLNRADKYQKSDVYDYDDLSHRKRINMKLEKSKSNSTGQKSYNES